jgi:4-aminobutyrate aminotransferase-like enzyme
MATIDSRVPAPILHRGEEQSNEYRRRLVETEPHCLRTFTPSLAVFSRSAGAYHWTPEGRMLADFTSGVLVANLGHNPTRWWKNVLGYMGVPDLSQQTDEYVATVPLTAYNAATEVEIEASRRLINCLQNQPGGARCEQVMWAASGSEAVQKALWAALHQQPGKDVILATRYGFHGKKGLAGAVTGSEKDPERDRRVRFIGFPMEECIDLERRKQPLDLAPYEDELQRVLEEYGDRLCCLITEPYLGGGGSFHPQPEYLQLLQRFCRENNLVFILDEVQANFGRTGTLFAFSHYGVEPDIVVLGKGLGNGVPVAAAVGRADLFAAMTYGEGSDTYSANPLSCAGVLATLDEYESRDVLANAAELAKVIEKGLVRLTETGVVKHVRGEGMVWGIECGAIGEHSPGEVANKLVQACYLGDDAGRAIHLLGPLAGKVIRISPPLTMDIAECQTYLDAMYNIAQNVQRNLS